MSTESQYICSTVSFSLISCFDLIIRFDWLTTIFGINTLHLKFFGYNVADDSIFSNAKLSNQFSSYFAKISFHSSSIISSKILEPEALVMWWCENLFPELKIIWLCTFRRCGWDEPRRVYCGQGRSSEVSELHPLLVSNCWASECWLSYRMRKFWDWWVFSRTENID